MAGWTWVEPFAGAAACTLRLVGGRELLPPVAWMGGKRRLALSILEAMGVPAGPPARVVLADAGPWGWVWPLLLEPGAAAKVAAVLRAWSGEHPRGLWQRLAAEPPAEDVHERAAQWLWLQARSASGVPIWWDGWRLEAGNGKTPTDRGEDLRWPAHQAQRARWEKGAPEGGVQDATNGQRGWLQGKSEGRTSAQAPWQKGGWRQQDHATGRDMAAGQTGRGEPGAWMFAGRPDRAQEARPAAMSGDKSLAGWRAGEEAKKARRGTRTIAQGHTNEEARGRTGGMVNPATIADRIEAVAGAFGGRWVASDGRGDPRPAGMKPDERHDGVRRANGIMDPAVVAGRVDALGAASRGVAWTVHHGDARQLELVAGAFVYLDPPYQGATGYGWDLARRLLLRLARRHHDAGAACVAISEAVPIKLKGWHHVDLTREGGKPEWLTLSRPPARLPQRQAELFSET